MFAIKHKPTGLYIFELNTETGTTTLSSTPEITFPNVEQADVEIHIFCDMFDDSQEERHQTNSYEAVELNQYTLTPKVHADRHA